MDNQAHKWPLTRESDGRETASAPVGQISKMRSGRWQARFVVPLGHPSGRGGEIVKAPHTFEPNTYGREAAGDWLRAEELRLNAEGASWRTLSEHAEDERIHAAAKRVPTFGEYADV